jgi:hypothetical protein
VVHHVRPERERSPTNAAQNLSELREVCHIFPILTSLAYTQFSSGLSGVRRELEQTKKAKSAVKRIILHKDTAQRVKQCDDKLSNLLQTFEVCRQFVIHFPGLTHGL